MHTQIYLSFIIFLCLSSGKKIMRVNADESQGDWCVANPATDDEKLVKNIDFACSKIDCQIIMPGGSCFVPDNPHNHASVAMNLYYQAQGRHRWNCDFEGSGLVTVIDPSYGSCKFQYRK
ncbi:unnamed protein product [Thlaspi arvense]|uniref:X8 domain-containing protein n=1 Tax=Thlaspi arvense TaxID=13288 RepID=A0AAU9R5Q5_THLAR|nr:unnamed protein product [Thlaspi arvense]CAH2034176.1 unnamed protein product [Thlaspi arvense]